MGVFKDRLLPFLKQLKNENNPRTNVQDRFRGEEISKIEAKFGRSQNDTKIPTTGNTCVDTANGATDTGNYGCEFYRDHGNFCGIGDDGDFTSTKMCCGCGGGSTGDILHDLI